MKGSTHRRCYCRDAHTGKPLGKKCPKLTSRNHGSHSIRQELPPREDGTRCSYSRAGYDTLKAAQRDLDHVRALLALADTDDHDSPQRLVTPVHLHRSAPASGAGAVWPPTHSTRQASRAIRGRGH